MRLKSGITISEHKAVWSVSEFRVNRRRVRPYVPYGRKSHDIYARILEPYEIFKVTYLDCVVEYAILCRGIRHFVWWNTPFYIAFISLFVSPLYTACINKLKTCSEIKIPQNLLSLFSDFLQSFQTNSYVTSACYPLPSCSPYINILLFRH
jgi:hypothetical protein